MISDTQKKQAVQTTQNKTQCESVTLISILKKKKRWVRYCAEGSICCCLQPRAKKKKKKDSLAF